MSNANQPNQPRFNRGAWLTLAFGLGLILLSLSLLAYRFTLPTDGWDAEYHDLDQLNWVYLENLVGAQSPLQIGDVLSAIEGQILLGTASVEYLPPPPGWESGNQVSATVIREGSDLSFQLPVVNWTPTAWLRRNILPSRLLNYPMILFLTAVGFLTFFRRPHLHSARALLIFWAAMAATFISTSLPDGVSAQFDRLAFTGVFFFNYAIFGALLLPAILAFAIHFPQPKKAIQQRAWLGLTPFGIGLILLAALYFLPGNTAYLGWIAGLGMILATIISLLHSYLTQRDAISRAQMRWAVGGSAAGLACILLAFPAAFGWIDNPLAAEILEVAGFTLGFSLIGLSLAIAVLRYRLFDIDFIIRKTLVYGILTVLLALFYFVLVTLFQNLLSSMTGQQSTLAIVISTLAIAALFSPLRRRIQDFIDRRFYRRKYDAEQALAAFSLSVREEVDLESLTRELLAVVEETMQPESVAVWLKEVPKTKEDLVFGLKK
ncbi:MAG: hypothetical protein R3335_13830 [Anaerolineales bacterium]|nr:hypothetical protein [Anaerolineales bacterium]